MAAGDDATFLLYLREMLETAIAVGGNEATKAAVQMALARETGGFSVSADKVTAGNSAQAAIPAILRAHVGLGYSVAGWLQQLDARLKPWSLVQNVSGPSYTVQSGIAVCAVTYTATGACSITIPAAVRDIGNPLVVWDAGWNAATHNIQISVEGRTINGDSAIGISTNRGELTLRPAPGVFDATGWMAY